MKSTARTSPKALDTNDLDWNFGTEASRLHSWDPAVESKGSMRRTHEGIGQSHVGRTRRSGRQRARVRGPDRRGSGEGDGGLEEGRERVDEDGVVWNFEVSQGAQVYASGASHKSKMLVSSGEKTTMDDFVREGHNVNVHYREQGGVRTITRLRVR